jgi:hypothetical protein
MEARMKNYVVVYECTEAGTKHISRVKAYDPEHAEEQFFEDSFDEGFEGEFRVVSVREARTW